MAAMLSRKLDAADFIEIIPLLRAYAVILTKSRHLADDLVQDTLERGWRHRASFQEGSDLRAWMFGILRNRFVDDVRKNNRVVLDVNGTIAGGLSTPPEQHWRLQYTDLIKAINALAPDARDAILLTLGAGLSHEEAAAILDCPLGTLKSRIRRARASLMSVVEIERPRSPSYEPRRSTAIRRSARNDARDRPLLPLDDADR